ncbi:hypothetical protein GE061_018712 [Apolygus lucorum]|uniref:Uncharacterized protein n=1 Tax=Apolygus lucorum TaxID=248454 RepID=A0A8S9X6C5_APOLU|nr:hypothetical protein GE061_018712 [Apolygus lucorum]
MQRYLLSTLPISTPEPCKRVSCVPDEGFGVKKNLLIILASSQSEVPRRTPTPTQVDVPLRQANRKKRIKMLSRGRMDLWAATFLAISLLEVAASPSPYAGFSLDDVRRPVYRGNIRTRDLKTDTEVIVKSDIAVVGAEDGRAATSAPFSPTTPTPMAESLKMVTKQLLQAPSATDMVATDVRTPPKVKSQVKSQEAVSTDFVPLGKGEAHPVVIEDPSGYEIITAPPVRHSTPQTEGLSTWILLSNGEQSTLASNKKKASAQPTENPIKKTHKPTLATPTIEKVKKPEDIKNTKPVQNKPTALPLKKHNVTKEKEEPSKSTIILQDPKFKNKTPVIVGKVPQNKTEVPVKKVTAQSSTPSILTRKRPITLSPTPPTRHVYDLVPTTSIKIESSTIESPDDTPTTEDVKDKTTRRPTTNKKKKKNKNRRRRPSKPDAETAESKVEETSVSPPSTKIETHARPISTRIYNYLAREVMPSVGVGLVGLVLTAGLAGLFLYPFGGGIARRNYDKGSGPVPDHQMYYYNSYSPHPEHFKGQPEESVFGQVLSSMNQNTFSPSYDSSKFVNNKYRYDAQDYSHKDNDYNVNGYAGSSDYSTLPDSVKNSDYGVKSDFNTPQVPDYSAKTTDYSLKSSDYSKTPDYAIKPSDYTGKTDYSVHDPAKSTEYNQPESSKYYSMDPMSSHYKLTDNSPQIDSFKHDEQVYPSLTEYASYTNAASVGTVDSFGDLKDDLKNDTVPTVQEDKSDKSQPHFSALIGSPQFTNTDFVGSVSLTGGYGAHEDVVRHRTGALAVEHGPRSLKVEDDKKSRRRRDVHDDFSNEIDGGDDRLTYQKPSSGVPDSTEASATSTAAYMIDSTTGSSKDITTDTSKDSTTTSTDDVRSTTVSSETSNTDTTTTTRDPFFEDSNDKDTISSSEKPNFPGSGSDSGFLGFISRLAQMKLKIGISLLRTTGEAFTRYLDIVAKRMEQAVRSMENRRKSTEHKRERRHATKFTKKRPIMRKKTKKDFKEH